MELRKDFDQQYDAVIIGAGPAGMMAAIEAMTANPTLRLLLVEKMPTPGLKLRLSGKGRCNLTNAAPRREFLAHFGPNGRFLKHAFAEFFSAELLQFFERLGIRCKLERGGRYFPESDRADDIAEALVREIRRHSIQLLPRAEVGAITRLPDNGFELALTQSRRNNRQRHSIRTAKLLLATGGKSYPKTGSDGGGLALAAQLGHTVTPPMPALVPLETARTLARQLQGLHLKNVTASLWSGNKKLTDAFGEMDFSDFGVSGPIILTLSRAAVPLLHQQRPLELSIDCKPALDHNALDQRLLRDIQKRRADNAAGLLRGLLPKQMVPVFVQRLRIAADKPLNQLTAAERKALRLLLKDFRCPITGHRDYNHAIVTAGGIDIHEISPQTMESTLAPGLYVAGEMLDIDADTGGFNLQAAFSTGWLAGRSLAQSVA